MSAIDHNKYTEYDRALASQMAKGDAWLTTVDALAFVPPALATLYTKIVMNRVALSGIRRLIAEAPAADPARRATILQEMQAMANVMQERADSPTC